MVREIKISIIDLTAVIAVLMVLVVLFFTMMYTFGPSLSPYRGSASISTPFLDVSTEFEGENVTEVKEGIESFWEMFITPVLIMFVIIIIILVLIGIKKGVLLADIIKKIKKEIDNE